MKDKELKEIVGAYLHKQFGEAFKIISPTGNLASFDFTVIRILGDAMMHVNCVSGHGDEARERLELAYTEISNVVKGWMKNGELRLDLRDIGYAKVAIALEESEINRSMVAPIFQDNTFRMVILWIDPATHEVTRETIYTGALS